MRLQRALVLIPLISISCLRAQTPSVFGEWQEPTGSILRIERCSTDVCMRVVHLGPRVPSTFDIHNPDPAKRTRPLCNLEIGSEFQLSDSAHAEGGRIYDPKSAEPTAATWQSKAEIYDCADISVRPSLERQRPGGV